MRAFVMVDLSMVLFTLSSCSYTTCPRKERFATTLAALASKAVDVKFPLNSSCDDTRMSESSVPVLITPDSDS